MIVFPEPGSSARMAEAPRRDRVYSSGFMRITRVDGLTKNNRPFMGECMAT